MSNVPNMPPAESTDRPMSEALYRLFEQNAFDDQRTYYRNSIHKSRTAARQVNKVRALFAFLTGLSSALAAYIVATQFGAGGSCVSVESNSCSFLAQLLPWLPLFSIIFPVLGGIFSTLADLYQWDRLATIYDAALKNLEVVDAESPLPGMSDADYAAWLQAYAVDALSVMRDEATQWGQLIKTPEALEKFLIWAEQKNREAAENVARAGQTIVSEPPAPPPPDAGIDPINPAG